LHHENSPRFSTDQIKMGAKEIENLKKELGIATNTPEPCVIANQRVDITGQMDQSVRMVTRRRKPSVVLTQDLAKINSI